MHAIRPDEPFVRAYCFFSIERDSGSVWHIDDQSMSKSPLSEKEKARKPLIFKAFRALQPGADDGT